MSDNVSAYFEAQARADAQNSADTAPKVIGRPFEKDDPRINRGGRPKKDAITRIFERILENDGNVQALEQAYLKILLEGRMASVLLTKEMLERTAGKVSQSVEVKTELREMSEEELLNKLAALRAEFEISREP